MSVQPSKSDATLGLVSGRRASTRLTEALPTAQLRRSCGELRRRDHPGHLHGFAVAFALQQGISLPAIVDWAGCLPIRDRFDPFETRIRPRSCAGRVDGRASGLFGRMPFHEIGAAGLAVPGREPRRHPSDSLRSRVWSGGGHGCTRRHLAGGDHTLAQAQRRCTDHGSLRRSHRNGIAEESFPRPRRSSVRPMTGGHVEDPGSTSFTGATFSRRSLLPPPGGASKGQASIPITAYGLTEI